MTAHALPYSCGQLVRQVSEQRVPLRLRLASKLLNAAPPAALDLLADVAVDSFEGIARRRTALALEFESLLERVTNLCEASELDADDSLYVLLQRDEAALRSHAQKLLNVWEPLHPAPDSRRARIRAAALRAGAALLALADTMRELRGAIQAHDANVQVMCRARTCVATTPIEIEQQVDAAIR